MKHRIIVAALASMVGTGTLAAELAIDVHGVRSGDGRVYLAVHGPATRDTFPSGEAVVEGLRAPARTGTMRFVVRDLAPGRYALSRLPRRERQRGARHEPHGDSVGRATDSGTMRVPRSGHPSFEAPAVDVDAASGVTTLTLAY